MKGSGAFNSFELNMSSTPWELKNGTKIPYEDVRVKYRVNQAEQIIFYNRPTLPTLQKSPWLYLVLAIQPFMTASILRLTVMLHSKPGQEDRPRLDSVGHRQSEPEQLGGSISSRGTVAACPADDVLRSNRR
ncbi:hypothetical protein JMJ77_0005856 [Colletotrichum scovillei]|uniref:Uncharacterized protein n=1 Tax=Colletotrichum scovillei TaxID=1209932 RepID=A0A9P7UMA6_9PEZI|nr:hypothetical protein JMJ77_0005856 [Colletotrichum scovillei]KAG7077024.1 hypothetical protein JMJ76_0014279 [Colletotrichum scovillei]KAG7084165.1 hypothetical protein JMJ78_0009604 [Colletotrichum scovillei]